MSTDSSSVSDASMFEPFSLGSLLLRNRLVMAPMTRSRAGAGDAPTELTAEYYAQRASAGLIVSEATFISPQAKGYAYTPGIYTDQQVAAWRLITDAVHDAGGLIFCQLWHVGRRSHPALQPGGEPPIAPSAVRPMGTAITEEGRLPFVTPRALRAEEIPSIVSEYGNAAACAKRAGFDGIELHAANGYLIDQFLRDGTNLREDEYGGTVVNRLRFLREVLGAVKAEWDFHRVGVRISPLSPVNDMKDSAPESVFTAVANMLNEVGVGYLHVIEGDSSGPREVPGGFDLQILRRAFEGPYIANNSYDLALASQALSQAKADLISFGRPFISNPDLVERLRAGAPLTEIDRANLYSGGPKGYIDYPSMAEENMCGS